MERDTVFVTISGMYSRRERDAVFVTISGMYSRRERDTVFVTISGMYSRREQSVLGGVVYLTRVPLPGNPYLNVLLSTFCGRGYLHLSPTSLNKHTLVWPC